MWLFARTFDVSSRSLSRCLLIFLVGGADGEDALCKALNGAGKRRQPLTVRDDIGMKRTLFEVELHCTAAQMRRGIALLASSYLTDFIDGRRDRCRPSFVVVVGGGGVDGH